MKFEELFPPLLAFAAFACGYTVRMHLEEIRVLRILQREKRLKAMIAEYIKQSEKPKEAGQ